MAESAVDSVVKIFFCHQCRVNIDPSPEYKCPRCKSGFVEEMASNNETNDEPRFLAHSFRSMQQNSGRGPSHPTQLRTRYHHRSSVSRLLGNLLSGWQDDSSPRNLAGDLDGNGLQFDLDTHLLRDIDLRGLDTAISQLITQLGGCGPPPSSQSQIDAVPKRLATESDIDHNCCICMQSVCVADKVSPLLCSHLFHTDCIISWLELHGTCPVCRQTVEPNVQQSHSSTRSTEYENSGSSANQNSTSNSRKSI